MRLYQAFRSKHPVMTRYGARLDVAVGELGVLQILGDDVGMTVYLDGKEPVDVPWSNIAEACRAKDQGPLEVAEKVHREQKGAKKR